MLPDYLWTTCILQHIYLIRESWFQVNGTPVSDEDLESLAIRIETVAEAAAAELERDITFFELVQAKARYRFIKRQFHSFYKYSLYESLLFIYWLSTFPPF